MRRTPCLRAPLWSVQKWPIAWSHSRRQLGSGGLDVVLEKAVAAWQPVHHQYDVVVVEGLTPGPAKLYASGLNQALARALDADVLLASGWPTADAAGGHRGARAVSLGHPRPRIPLRVWPNGSPSRPAGTRRMSTNA
jgi:hypothetical protein